VRYAATICLACAVILGCFPGERQVNTYETLDAARADRLFERGWVPDVLPPDAGPIVEAHDLDTNSRCSKSSFPPGGTPDVHSALLGLAFEPHPGKRSPLPHSICPFKEREVPNSGLALSRLSAQSDEREFAILAGGTLYFWSSPR
jgi:hypothetical protein